jgi:poly(glycerol-phosphate) alpha-glucosyltransferase
MSAAAPPERQSAGEAVFVFGSVAMRRGGVTRAILERMRCYADAGIRVRVFLTKYGSNEEQEEAAVREAWSLPGSVEFLHFWQDGAPGGGGAPAGARVHVGTRRFGPDGRLVRVDQYDGDGALQAREYFDPRGRLVQTAHIDASTGKPTMLRWFAASGACWLTTWLNGDGNPRKAVRHLPEPEAYDHFGQCVAEWVDAEIAGEAAPMVFSDTREQDATLLTLRHPSARRVAVVHNGHLGKPYRENDVTKANYRPLLDNLDCVDALVVLTTRQREHITARYGAKPVVINHAAPAVPESAAHREPGLLVVVARLDAQKRLEDAITAFARAAPRVPGSRFDIYGTGRQAGALKHLVTELELDDRVRFRGFTERPLEAFAAASATVLTSRYEGWGLVITEAMAVGTPVVAYDINYGPAEVIRHGVDGLLVPPTDIDALAEAMVRVLGDPDYAARLGERAREVSERFSRFRWRSEWLELYAAVTENPPRRTAAALPSMPAGTQAPSSSGSTGLPGENPTSPPAGRLLRRAARAATSTARRGATLLPGRGRARATRGARLTPGPVPGEDGTWRQGYYRDGLPVLLRGDGAHHVSSGHDRRA